MYIDAYMPSILQALFGILEAYQWQLSCWYQKHGSRPVAQINVMLVSSNSLDSMVRRVFSQSVYQLWLSKNQYIVWIAIHITYMYVKVAKIQRVFPVWFYHYLLTFHQTWQGHHSRFLVGKTATVQCGGHITKVLPLLLDSIPENPGKT